MNLILKKFLGNYILLFTFFAAIFFRLIVFSVNDTDFPTGYDYCIYYNMALNTFKGFGPQINFIYSYLHLPIEIIHLEDYYEPVFGIINSLFLFLDNGSYKSSLYISFFSGILLIPMIYKYSQLLGYTHNQSLISSLIICINPFMIYRSSILMKEPFISLLYLLLFMYIIKNKDKFFQIGFLCIFIGLCQYESIVILYLSISLFLLLEKKVKKLAEFSLSFCSVFLVYTMYFYYNTGLFISTKYIFISTKYTGAPFGSKNVNFDIYNLLNKIFTSELYIYRSILLWLGLSFVLLSILGIFKNSNKQFSKFISIFIFIYLLVHGTSVDLWDQDFMVIYCLLLPFCINITFKILNSDKIDSFHYLIFFVPIYQIIYNIMTYFNIQNDIFFYPQINSNSLVPIPFALLFTYALRNKFNKFKFVFFINMIFSLMLPLNIWFNNFVKIYNENSYEDHLSNQTLIHFINNVIPSDKVLLTNSIYISSGINQKSIVLNTDQINIIISRYSPDYLLTTSDNLYGFSSSKIIYKINNFIVLDLKNI